MRGPEVDGHGVWFNLIMTSNALHWQYNRFWQLTWNDLWMLPEHKCDAISSFCGDIVTWHPVLQRKFGMPFNTHSSTMFQIRFVSNKHQYYWLEYNTAFCSAKLKKYKLV